MHLKRLIVAAIILPLLYFYITELSAAYFLFLLITVSAIAQYEFYSMCNVRPLLKYSGIILGMLTISGIYFSKAGLTDSFIISFIIIACIRLFLIHEPASSLKDTATTLIAVVYISGLLSYQVFLRANGASWIIFLYGCVWASDSFAYYIGKGIGKRKLYEKMSPNKTIAGAFGSVAGGAAGAVILKTMLLNEMPLDFTKTILFGIIIGAVAIIGDLVESMFKRDVGVKDSSGILPGHGGMLDKIDSMLFAGPALYWCCTILGLVH
ncbi:MAG: phosphatidate cytidylyltransferase [Nitrospirae bacterium]|nr:phosphatidate cytidylyltransferase [Nitrospirota bacterium]